MLWQKASARTVAVMTPSAPRSQLQLLEGADRRRALRRLQYAAKSCSPSSGAEAAFIGVHVQRPVVPQHMAAQQRIDARRVVAHPVGVPPPDRREARVEAGGRLRDRATPVRRAAAARPAAAAACPGARPRAPRAGRRARPARGRARPRRCAPPRSARGSDAGHRPQGPLQLALDGPPLALLGPARRSPCRRTTDPAGPGRARAPPRHSRNLFLSAERGTGPPPEGSGPVFKPVPSSVVTTSSSAEEMLLVLDGLLGLGPRRLPS